MLENALINHLFIKKEDLFLYYKLLKLETFLII
jgi:hypothetical protein